MMNDVLVDNFYQVVVKQLRGMYMHLCMPWFLAHASYFLPTYIVIINTYIFFLLSCIEVPFMLLMTSVSP